VTGRYRAPAFAFVTAFVTLAFQILAHRMVSAKFVNNYAFLIISLTMLGFAAAGALLSRFRQAFLAARNDVLCVCAASFVLTAVGAAWALYRTTSEPGWATSPTAFVGSFLQCMPFALAFAVPFACCGMILGLLLSAPEYPVGRVYFADLVGSACGAVAVVPAIGSWGVESSVLAAGAVLLVTAPLLFPPRARWSRILVVLTLAALAAAPLWKGSVLRLRYPEGSPLAATQVPGSGNVLEYVAWDPLARIEVQRTSEPDVTRTPWPSLFGPSKHLPSRMRLMITQNNNAWTYAVHYDGSPDSVRGIEDTIYAAAYRVGAIARPRVAIVGVGGGFDVVTALFFEASHVVGAEVNAATYDIVTRVYAEHCRAWRTDPRVRIVQDEGRHFLTTTPELFDVLQLSGVDSASGTPGAAHIFSENYLYTAEAFDLYLSRLSEDGVLNVMRNEFVPPREMLRALATAVAALRKRGVSDPASHIVTVTDVTGSFTALLVKRRPFTPEEVERLGAWASAERPFRVSAAPGRNAPEGNLYQRFLALGSPAREAAFARLYPFDVSPATDDRPFFFKYSRVGHLFSRDPLIRANVPVMEWSLVLLLGLLALSGLAFVLLPLRHLRRSETRLPRLRRLGLYFTGIGVGYMMIEIALLQEFALFLGHPNYSLSVVLAALLFATGLGAWLSPLALRRALPPRFIAYTLAGVVLLEYLLAIPWLHGWIALPLAARAGVVSVLCAPLGLLMGMFFPIGLEAVKAQAPDYAPWAWSLNGFASVLAPVLAIGIAMTWGTSALLLSALPVYLFATMAFPEPAGRFAMDQGQVIEPAG
jgi:spermidine synthase